MDNIKRLEVIKSQMQENLEALKEFQKLQLKWYEEVMNLSDLEKVDMAIENFNEEYKHSTLFNEIIRVEKENFRRLMTLAWNFKVDELAEDACNA